MTQDPRQSVQAALAGDRHAFDSLFARNLPKLMAYIRLRMGDAMHARESVSDLAQSVCREVLQDMDEFEYRGEESFRKWLFLQASRKLIDRHRYLKRARRDVGREMPVASDEDSESLLMGCADLCTPSRGASARDELRRIEEALHQLSDNQRRAVTLAKLMALPYPEIAEHLGCTEGAVRALVAHGLAKLSIILGET